MKILIADDELLSRKILLKCLEQYGECDSVGNGLEAWTAFQSAFYSESGYELVVLDLQMPVMDGREALIRIRDFENQSEVAREKRVKIVIATGNIDKENILGAFEDQCDCYITKPYSRATLIFDLERSEIIPASDKD